MDNSTQAAIEKNIIETLNVGPYHFIVWVIFEINHFFFEQRLSCPIIQAILNVESNLTIKTILIDQAYKQEKLNLFIWLITKFVCYSRNNP